MNCDCQSDDTIECDECKRKYCNECNEAHYNIYCGTLENQNGDQTTKLFICGLCLFDEYIPDYQ